MLKKNDRPGSRWWALRAWAPRGLAALMLSGLGLGLAAPNEPCYPWTATISSGESDLKGYTAEAVCLEIAERKTSYSWAHGPKVTTYNYIGLLPSGPDGSCSPAWTRSYDSFNLGPTMNDSILSNELEIEYCVDRACLCIWHPNLRGKRVRVVEVRKATLEEMSFSEASQFVGERILLLIPAMREQFKDYFWGDDGETPPKRT